MSQRFLLIKRCVVCGKPFKPVRYDQKYCSEVCRKEVLKRQWRESKKRRRQIIKKLLAQSQKELEEKGARKTHEAKIPESLGTDAPSTDLRIVNNPQPRVKGALWLEKEEKKRA